MRQYRVHAFIALVCVAATLAAGSADWHTLALLDAAALRGYLALLAIGLFSEAMAIRIGGRKNASATSITFIPLLASVQLFGPAPAILLMSTTGAVGEFLIRKKPVVRAIFNIAQWTLASAIAGAVFLRLGGVPLELRDSQDFAGQLGPFVGFGLTFLLLNHAAVSLAIALSEDLPFSDVWNQVLGRSGATLHDLLISPIAIAVAFLYVQLGLPGILVVLFPLLFIRQAYFQRNELVQANTDLLTALVKAIETRDPYTSGHSIRVAHLARQICEQLSLPPRTTARIEMAAKLHDIGKIDAVYSTILTKPGTLSLEERGIIESHATKGAEFLRSLTSVPAEVIQIVRHHHEREDGGGYPDGLSGGEIPFGSRVIIVSDAVDAMLSDRPYRKALSVKAVVGQLVEHAGTQFDRKVVDALVKTELLENYAAVMRVGHAPIPDPRSATPRRPRKRRSTSPRQTSGSSSGG